MALSLLFLAAFFGELLVYTWSRVQCTNLKFEIADETSRQNELVAMRNKLKIERARLKSPQRIAEIAREKLGLTTPSAKQTVIIPLNQ